MNPTEDWITWITIKLMSLRFLFHWVWVLEDLICPCKPLVYQNAFSALSASKQNEFFSLSSSKVHIFWDLSSPAMEFRVEEEADALKF